MRKQRNWVLRDDNNELVIVKSNREPQGSLGHVVTDDLSIISVIDGKAQMDAIKIQAKADKKLAAQAKALKKSKDRESAKKWLKNYDPSSINDLDSVKLAIDKIVDLLK